MAAAFCKGLPPIFHRSHQIESTMLRELSKPRTNAVKRRQTKNMSKFYTIGRSKSSPKMTRDGVIETIYKEGIGQVRWIHDENRRNIANWELLLIWRRVEAKKKQNQGT
jgi:hypothetical protein